MKTRNKEAVQMKKLLYLFLIPFLFVSCSKISAEDKQKADSLYKSCLSFECFDNFSENEKAIEKLNQAINLNSGEWNYYLQKIKLYKYRYSDSVNEKEQNDILDNIISIYKEWETNGNKLDAAKKFGLGCAYIADGNSDIGISMLTECYNRLENNSIKKNDELAFMESVISGIIIGKINKDNVSQVLIFDDNEFYNDFIMQEVNETDFSYLVNKYIGGF